MGAYVPLRFHSPGGGSMSERVKIGPRIDADLWERFRNDVQERKGQTRGVLGDELENAIRQYLRDEARPMEQEINRRLTRMEDAMGITPADGGTTPSEADGHTHAPSRVQAAADEKPAANAATEKKVQYLAERVLDEVAPDSRALQEVPRSLLVETVKDEYGFRSDTAKRYVDELVSHFDLVPHPNTDAVLVTDERRASIRDTERDEQAEQSADRMDDVTEHYETES